MQFKLPELGEGVHEGEMVKWRIQAGETIQFDQPLCEIMTDKATVEIPSPFRGKISELHAKEGQTVKVGQVMLTFEADQSAEKALTAALGKSNVSGNGSGSGGGNGSGSGSGGLQYNITSAGLRNAGPEGNLSSNTREILASPSTRRLARKQGIDLRTIQPTGPKGRILKEDVTKLLTQGSGQGIGQGTGGMMSATPLGPNPSKQIPTNTPLERAGFTGTIDPTKNERRVPFRGLRKKISEKMRLSKDRAAHFTYVEECDATELVKLRTQAKIIGEKQGIKVTYLPFVMKAMVAALRQFPILNATLDENSGELVYRYYYNIGLSIQTEDGLTAPVIKDVAHKSLMDLAREIQVLVEKARTKKLTLEDFSGGTITITNAGSIGGLLATPIINYPEVAILGFNKIARKPVVKEIRGKEKIVVRDWTLFSISLDHRIVDGAIGAEFMKLFIQYIENPALLLLENF